MIVSVASVAATLAGSPAAVAAPPDAEDGKIIMPAFTDNEAPVIRKASPANPVNSATNPKRAVQNLAPKIVVVPHERVSPNSRVGLVAAYVDAVEASAKADSRIAAIDQQLRVLEGAGPGDPKLKALQAERVNVVAARETLIRAQREALDAAANKPMSDDLLAAINAILGMESSSSFTGEGKIGADTSSSVRAEPGPGAESAPLESAR